MLKYLENLVVQGQSRLAERVVVAQTKINLINDRYTAQPFRYPMNVLHFR